jgi:hypothetical protein
MDGGKGIKKERLAEKYKGTGKRGGLEEICERVERGYTVNLIGFI